VTRNGKGRFFLVHGEDGLLAISLWCTHKNGATVWQKESWHFYCPFHGAKFDPTGCYVGNMGCAPMRLHPIAIDAAGAITVDTDRFYARAGYDAAQSVPARPGAGFRADGLDLLTAARKATSTMEA
jgi:nitrite reductase/ring-hydroxylating ferredoxin subunit